MSGKGYWVYLGPVLNESEVQFRQAVSAAANRWQTGLLTEVEKIQEVQVVSYRPEPMWPRGELAISAIQTKSVDGAISVGYLNAPAVREWSLAKAHVAALTDIVRRRGPPSLILTYNVSHAYAVAAATFRQREGVPWIPIIADIPDRARSRKYFDATVRQADGRVCLSRSVYDREVTKAACFHLDGGVSRLPAAGDESNEDGLIVYSGSLSTYGGVDLLLDAFGYLDAPTARLWICGKGKNAKLSNSCRRDSRIRFLGVIPEEELVALSRAAAVFVNPRPTNLIASGDNFPSKVLEYLSYGKPIVSTWTPGLDKVYRDYLLVPEADTPSALAEQLTKALSMTGSERLEWRERATRFLEAEKLWSVQTRRFVEWANMVISS